MVAQPEQHLLTAEEFAVLPRDGLRLELIEGVLDVMAPAFEDHGVAAMRLGIIVGQYVMEHDLGRTFAAETGFLLARKPDTIRAPDFAFIQKQRVGSGKARRNWVTTIPDLVAEVVSSGDRVGEIADTVQKWLAVGVRLVWVAYPSTGKMTVHRVGRADVILNGDDILDGEDVIVGFTTKVERIFG